MADASVVVCSWGADAAGKGTEEALTLGKRLAQALGAGFDWLILGPLPAEATKVGAAYGVAHVDSAANVPAEFQPDVYVESLAKYSGQQSPAALVFSQTYDARLVAPRLAARLNTGVVMNAVDVSVDGGSLSVTASAYGGDTRAVYSFSTAQPYILSVTQGAVEPNPQAGGAAEVRQIDLDLSGVQERINVVQRAQASGPRLEDARIVVSGGRGLMAAENYKLVERLAALLGGLPGASRAIVDDGWVGPEVQVGLTGRITKPELYIAAGISGASQHMAGCSASRAIVGINRDKDASIFRYSRYGVIGDAKDVLSELIALIEDTK